MQSTQPTQPTQPTQQQSRKFFKQTTQLLTSTSLSKTTISLKNSNIHPINSKRDRSSSSSKSIKVDFSNFKKQNKFPSTLHQKFQSLSCLNSLSGLNDESFEKIPKEQLEKCVADLLTELNQPFNSETKASIEITDENDIKRFKELNEDPEELYDIFLPITAIDQLNENNVTSHRSHQSNKPNQVTQTVPTAPKITRKANRCTDTIKFLGGTKKVTTSTTATNETTEKTETIQSVDQEDDIQQDSRDVTDESDTETKINLVKIIETHQQHFPTKTRKSKIVETVQQIALTESIETSLLSNLTTTAKNAKNSSKSSKINNKKGSIVSKKSRVKNNKSNKKAKSSSPPRTTTSSSTTSTSSTSSVKVKDIPYAANKLTHLKVPTKIEPKTIFDKFPSEIPNFSAANKLFKTKIYEHKQWPTKNREEGTKMVNILTQQDHCDFISKQWNEKTLKDITPSSIGGIFQAQCMTLHEACVILNIAFHVIRDKLPNGSPMVKMLNFWINYHSNLVKKVGDSRKRIRNTMHRILPPRQAKDGKKIEKNENLSQVELGKRANLVEYVKKMVIPEYITFRNKKIPKLPNKVNITEFFASKGPSVSLEKGESLNEDNFCIDQASSYAEMLIVTVYLLVAYLPTESNRQQSGKDVPEGVWHTDPIKIPYLVSACNTILTLFNLRELLNPDPDYLKGESAIKTKKSSFASTPDFIHDGKYESLINHAIIDILNESFVFDTMLELIGEELIYQLLTPIDEEIAKMKIYQNWLTDKHDLLISFAETRLAGYLIVASKNYRNRRISEDNFEMKKPKASKRTYEEFFVCDGTSLEPFMSPEAKKLKEYFKKRKYKHYGSLADDQKQK